MLRATVHGSLRSHLPHLTTSGVCASPALHTRPHRQHQHHRHRASTTQLNAMPLTYQSPIESKPPQEHRSSVIFLHGLGDSGAGWSEVAYQFHAGKLKHTKFIFPHAPRRPITLNWGMSMPGWYDIASLDDINQKEDAEGLRESMRFVEELIAKEVAAGIPPSRIAVGGFSQGGAVALMMLRSKSKLAAIVGLSTYLPLSKEKEVVAPDNLGTPVFMGHGDADQVVAYQYGRQSQALLASIGVDVDFATYSGMPHSACPQELKDVEEFLDKYLNKQ